MLFFDTSYKFDKFFIFGCLEINCRHICRFTLKEKQFYYFYLKRLKYIPFHVKIKFNMKGDVYILIMCT